MREERIELLKIDDYVRFTKYPKVDLDDEIKRILSDYEFSEYKKIHTMKTGFLSLNVDQLFDIFKKTIVFHVKADPTCFFFACSLIYVFNIRPFINI